MAFVINIKTPTYIRNVSLTKRPIKKNWMITGACLRFNVSSVHMATASTSTLERPTIQSANRGPRLYEVQQSYSN